MITCRMERQNDLRRMRDAFGELVPLRTLPVALAEYIAATPSRDAKRQDIAAHLFLALPVAERAAVVSHCHCFAQVNGDGYAPTMAALNA